MLTLCYTRVIMKEIKETFNNCGGPKMKYNVYEDVMKDLVKEEERYIDADPARVLEYEGWIREVYENDLKKDQKKHDDVGEAIYALLEELYQSGDSINERRIDAAAFYLCDISGIDKSILDGSLSVVHWKDTGRKPTYDWFSDFTKNYAQTLVDED